MTEQTTACVANIGPRGRQQRLRMGMSWLAIGCGAAGTLALAGLPRWLRLGLFGPFALGAFGVFQAYEQTCVGLIRPGGSRAYPRHGFRPRADRRSGADAADQPAGAQGLRRVHPRRGAADRAGAGAAAQALVHAFDSWRPTTDYRYRSPVVGRRRTSPPPHVAQHDVDRIDNAEGQRQPWPPSGI